MSALLLPNEILSMSAQSVRRLVESGEGDCALLYLALLSSRDSDEARRDLHWDETRMNAAWNRLTDMGLLEGKRETVPKPAADPAADLPRYSRGDVTAALEGEPDFCGLYREVEALLGRPLSDADLQSLLAVYDGLAMDPEVILLLVNYVIRTVRRRKGNPGAVPRVSQIKSEAFRWKRLGLDSAEAAESWLRRQEQADRREWAVLSAVGVTERRPAVEKEREYIDRWVELDISDALISMAHERTVFRKGQRNWPYMNKILLAWHEAGWRTPEQVKAGDKPADRSAPPRCSKAPADFQPTDERIRKGGDWLDEFLEGQKKGE